MAGTDGEVAEDAPQALELRGRTFLVLLAVVIAATLTAICLGALSVAPS